MTGNPKLLRPAVAQMWQQVKDFSGCGGAATYLWPRWILLRAVGVVFIIIFSGIINESAALIGPQGLVPLRTVMAQLRTAQPTTIESFLKAPTLFWISTSPSMLQIVQWGGLFSALALLANILPRLALFGCWLSLLSFARGWLIFSDPQVDWLMLEVALLCIPFAPAGFRPGIGAASPPRPLVIFMVRWLLFRVMFESGLAKILSGDPHWANLSAMATLYEVAPCPTILGYLDHQLPHFWHVGEAVLTFAAELVAPLLAVLAGRRGRWWAFGLWFALQAGIQLTCNFGWLNTASIALGLLLFDDQMLTTAAHWFRRPALAQYLANSAARQTWPTPAPAWQRHFLSVALWSHFYLSIIAFGNAASMPRNIILDSISRPLKFIFDGFGSVNAYQLYARLDLQHVIAEFIGSNDGGQTWRPYEFRYFPQRLDHISSFIAPRFPRFEATLQIEFATRDKPATLYRLVATQLLEQNPQVLSLFAGNPFLDRPPQMIRIAGYRYTFTNLATYRATGNFWQRVYTGEYMPMIYQRPMGEIGIADTEFDQIAARAFHGNPAAQSHLGFLFVSGEEGVQKNGAEAARWLGLAAAQGVAAAQLNLALILAQGDGVPKDLGQAAQWCQRAAHQGLAAAQDRLGVMYVQGEGVTKNDTEALAWFQIAARAGHAEAKSHAAYIKTRASLTLILAAERRAQAISDEITSTAKKIGKN